MPAPGGEANEVERLKSLLFSPETARLTQAERQIQGLENWVGDAPRLEAATAGILVDALRRAEVARHRELAAALAPVVVAAIRAEIQNSRDMMVEALYPITGRLVAAAVANAFRELIEAINQRVDALVSTNSWRLRFKSLATGRSVAEIALAEARSPIFERLLLLERGSGRLIAQWRPAGARADNPDLISGLIAAITEFASNALSERHGELRTLDLGPSQLFLRASSRVILAAEAVGEIGRPDREQLDAGFLEFVDRHDRGAPVAEADLAALAAHIVQPPARSGKSGRAKWIVIGLLVALGLAAALAGPVQRWRRGAQIEAAYRGALRADPELSVYPLTMRERWGAGQVTIRGLANSQASLDRLVAALTTAAAPMAVVPEVRIVAGVAEARQAREAGAREVAALAGLTARVDAIEAGLARTSAAVEKAAGAAEGARSEAAAGIAAVRAEAGAETAQLEAAISGAEARAKDARQSLAGEAEARSSRQGAEISALRGELEAVRARLSAPGADRRSRAGLGRILPRSRRCAGRPVRGRRDARCARPGDPGNRSRRAGRRLCRRHRQRRRQYRDLPPARPARRENADRARCAGGRTRPRRPRRPDADRGIDAGRPRAQPARRIRTPVSGRAGAVSAAAKVMLLGDIGVGKSSLARRLVFDRFESDYKSTIGVDVLSCDVLTALGPLRLILWDTDGDFGMSIFETVYSRAPRPPSSSPTPPVRPRR